MSEDSLPFHLNDFHWTFVGADSASLAVVVVDFGHVLSVKFDAGFWAVDPADSTLGTFFKIDRGPKCSPSSSFSSTCNPRTRQWGERQITHFLRGFCHHGPPDEK